MCGLVGFLRPRGFVHAESTSCLRQMADALAHRGPDGAGEWVDSFLGVALAHRRLAVVELSEAGHQPIMSPSERFVMVFNGEIYNHKELRALLPKQRWRGDADSETLIVAIEQLGFERALRLCVGMFAIAVWDRAERTLLLARDRLGEKPLYYGWQGGTFMFASELKALRYHPDFNSEVNSEVIPIYMRYGYLPAPYSIWRGINKLLPGTWLGVRLAEPFSPAQPERYWSLESIIDSAEPERFVGSDEAAQAALDASIRDSVTQQMVADVPIGAFLSGGIDSSLVVAVMQAISPSKVKTFTIGFSEEGMDEAPYARRVAKYLKTEHCELYVGAKDTMEVIPKLASTFDEPFGDSSAIPTILLSRLARQHVTVALTGDGGDELFGGYRRYQNKDVRRLWRAVRALPGPIRGLLVQSLRSLTAERILAIVDSRYRGARQSLLPSVHRLADISECRSDVAFYRAMTAHWPHLATNEAPTRMIDESGETLCPSQEVAVERMMVADTLTYLPDDILCKVDRTAMASGLETRAPLLDHRVVQFAWRLSFESKIRNGSGKWILRKLLSQYMPTQLFDRPKMGFAIPVDTWLRGPLLPWADDLLSEARLSATGFADPKSLRKRWIQHRENRYNWRDSLWVLLMLQAWINEPKR